MFSTIASLGAFILVFNLAALETSASPMPWDRYVVNFHQATYFEAWQLCDAIGLRLATVNSPADTELLERALIEAKAPQKSRFFIAGTTLGAKGSWIWISTNKKVGSPYGYTRWQATQPDNAGGVEHCMEIYYDKVAYWNDYECDKKRGYICETYIK